MQIFKGVNGLLKNRSLILRMAYKELTDRYAGSALGLVWAIIQPLFLISLYTFVFTFVFKVRISADDSPIKYAFYALCGLVPWICMTESLSRSIMSVASKASLVKQAIFPTEILPVSTAFASFTSLLIGLGIYFLMAIFLSPCQITWLILLLPLIIFFHFLFTLGVSYFLAIGGVYFRDLVEIVTVILTVGMFVTPILYLESSVPFPLQILMNFNLASHLIYMYRDVLFYGQINHPWSFIIFILAAVLIFILGNYSFRKVQHLLANVL